MVALRVTIPRLTSTLVRRVLVRRNWPRPDDFDRMSLRAFDAYVVATGLDADILESLAER
jgi:hypothetical protein